MRMSDLKKIFFFFNIPTNPVTFAAVLVAFSTTLRPFFSFLGTGFGAGAGLILFINFGVFVFNSSPVFSAPLMNPCEI